MIPAFDTGFDLGFEVYVNDGIAVIRSNQNAKIGAVSLLGGIAATIQRVTEEEVAVANDAPALNNRFDDPTYYDGG